MKTLFFFLLLLQILLCEYAIKINKFWYDIKERNALVYLPESTGKWSYSVMNNDGDIIKTVILENFIGSNDLSDEFMVETLEGIPYLFVFLFNS